MTNRSFDILIGLSLLGLLILVMRMNERLGENVVVFGTNGMGKTCAQLRRIIEAPPGADYIADPKKDNLAKEAIVHASGNILHDNLSSRLHALRRSVLKPSTKRDPEESYEEDYRTAEAFIEFLAVSMNADSLSGSPQKFDWAFNLAMMMLSQSRPRTPDDFLAALTPGTEKFDEIIHDCRRKEFSDPFKKLKNLRDKAQWAEIGPLARLAKPIFRSPQLRARWGGTFGIGAHLQNFGKLFVERGGDEIGDGAMQVIIGSDLLAIIDHGRSRPKPWPMIRVRIDEATNARLLTPRVLRSAAENNSDGLYWEFLLQRLDVPGGADDLLQVCHRHEWFGCRNYDMARKGAIDIVAGLAIGEDDTRAKRIQAITNELMTFGPGWRWVRDKHGSRKEFVPLLENPWPAWPGLRERKLQEKLAWIYSRPEYRTGEDDDPPSSTGSEPESPSPTKSPEGGSPAQRLKRRGNTPADGSESRSGESE